MILSSLILLIVYNGFNMYCDVRWRITKNLWHVLYLLLFLTLIIVQQGTAVLWAVGWGCIAFLFYGLLLEAAGSTAPGDTKMMMTNGLGICCYVLAVNGGFVRDEMRSALRIFLFSLVLILFLIDAYRFGRKYGLKRVVKAIFENTIGYIMAKAGMNAFAPSSSLDNKDFRILPGAVMITMSVGITISFFIPAFG
ncbi:hypothetical protein M2444_004750 [Paenibacillus sp. PastF-3]|uniref:hypothetical protein n=1 Tax=unclassified Paenibacillus TaxID=185978 RepID=UPI001D6B9D66|nr:hypothetical protein [Paenibacillus sp. PastF-3]MBY3621115.1 hypothetical protein [Acinetobacter sp. CUI P1]MDH6372921.1 hypothetical protein [Paenibacillus sp. PastF-3]